MKKAQTNGGKPQPQQEQTIAPLEENDIAAIRGQLYVKRALEVAAAGGHNLLLLGSPGVGKDALARTLPGLLPAKEEAPRLFLPQPNEERYLLPEHGDGVLFLRDIHLWTVRDLTRLWIERGRQAEPIQLIGTFQFCPCGYYMDPHIVCDCPVGSIVHHQRSKAGFLGSFDMHVEVATPRPEDLLDQRLGERSAVIRERVEAARTVQERRGVMNVALTTLERAQAAAHLDDGATTLLAAAVKMMQLRPQALLNILRVSRTIADLAASERVRTRDLAEAIQYRPRVYR